MRLVNRQWVLRSHPHGWPEPGNWELVRTEAPSPGPGQVLLRALYLSVDPYMRGRISGRATYAPPVPLGGVMVGAAVAEVVQSDDPGFAAGDVVEHAGFGWQEYAVSDGRALRKVDPSLGPVSTALGVLGMNGLTAYFGLLDVCHPRPGETVVVSGAAGATGSIAGQIARIAGCRVVGIAGSARKVAWLTGDLGFDAAVDYKAAGDLRAALAKHCPDGIDCYFDNVGGPVTDAVLSLLALRARIAVCGQIALYNEADFAPVGPRELRYLIAKRARAEGFLVFDYGDRYGEGLARLSRWVRVGDLNYQETVYEGIDNVPQALIDMMGGENVGKMVVRVGD